MEDPVVTWLKKHYGSFGSKLASSLDAVSEKQRDFCDRYLSGVAVAQAAREAGLRTDSPQLLLHVPKISAYLNILAAKQEVDLGKASAAEMMDRIRATPVLSSDSDVLPPEVVAELNDQLDHKAAGLNGLADEDLLANVSADPDFGILQVPAVKMLHNDTFGPEWVIENLVRVAERCLQIEPVFDKKGRPIGEFQFQAAPALKALELVGKTMAMFRDRVEHGVGSLADAGTSEIDDRLRALVDKHPQLQGFLTLEHEHEKKPNRKH